MQANFKSRLGIIINSVLAMVLIQTATLSADEAFTLETARAAAEKGDAKANYFLAKKYEKGEAVAQDFVKAAEYMRQSAEQGYAFAQTDLGAMYTEGQGVNTNLQEAAKWYRKGAENGDSLAQYGLGLIYSLGRGVTNDAHEAVKWYRKAADQNQPDALLALGDIYLKGTEGIPEDDPEAFRWFQKALAQGRYEALSSLGFLYENGGGLDEKGSPIGPNPELALKCYREAAWKGDGRGQENLGRMYLDGQGVKTDLVEAYKWFIVSRKNGELTADKYLWDFETAKILSPEQKAEAHRQADEFQKSLDQAKAGKARD